MCIYLFLHILGSCEEIPQGINWLKNGDIENLLEQKKQLPDGFTMSGLEVGISTNSKNGKYALSVNPLKNESWLRFPIYTRRENKKVCF